MKNDLTSTESLGIINEMIAQARNNFRKRSTLPAIVAGYCVAGVALLNFALLFLLPNPAYSFHCWWLMIPMWIAIRLIDKSQERKSIVKTHVDVIIAKTWAAFGYSVIIALLSIFGLAFAFHSWSVAALITPVLLTLTGLVQYITGCAFRFRPYIHGGIIFWIGALLAVGTYFINMDGLQFIVLALCMILGFVIPGYLANKKMEE